MLKRLHIRNYALIDRAEIDFSERLTIITGETGAGKSILLGALGLVMGERADTKIFYNDQEKCVVEAWFDVSKYDLREFFTEQELDYDAEVVIRRELSPAGKSRAFVNDTPVNNQVLQRLTEALIDLHQQFDVLDIHNVNFQLRMIDALADNAGLLQDYQRRFREYQADRRQLAQLSERSANAAKEMDFLRFQLSELQQAGLSDGEQEQLESELARLTNAEDIKRTYGAAYNYLGESEQNIIQQLQEIARSMSGTRRVSAELNALGERLDSLILDLQDISKDCERISENTEHDPQRIEEVSERLNTIYKLQKKHGAASVTELLQLQENFEQQLGGFTDLGEQIAQLERRIAGQELQLRGLANLLSERRKIVPTPFEEKVHAMLAQLSMPHARIRVDIHPTEALTPTGSDEVQFLFASNVGSKYLPIKDVASGGELSRLTLCTKSLVADAIPLPTLIFDEIDTGISGDVSLKMGLILKELSDRHQVVSITHTPQIAARADKHYFVYKQVQDGRTVTYLRLLNADERVRALAVMVGGNPPSEAAMAAAKELMSI
ncbi:MAG: DNA repair protein RecN [Thermoanaerobaculia bacterium]|nr:DNA repair protein RecN [Thermoanaerobaculia bacterium]